MASPKSSTLACALRRDHDVAGLHVAVDDAARMSGGKRLGDLQGNRQQRSRMRAAVRARPARSVSPSHVLHRDEEATVGFADFVHGADVRVVE